MDAGSNDCKGYSELHFVGSDETGRETNEISC